MGYKTIFGQGVGEMDIMNIVDGCIDFARDKIDRLTAFWDDLDSDKKKLLIGCVAGAVVIIAVAAIAYGIGKSKGKKALLEEDEF